MTDHIILWDETISKLEAYNLTWDDVKMIWIERYSWGEEDPERFKITKENFERLAKDTEYDNGYGGTMIHEGLHMRGYDKTDTPFIMFRNEYDSSEWWEIHFFYIDLPLKEVTSLGNFPFDENTHKRRVKE